jgi:hypothetical protein
MVFLNQIIIFNKKAEPAGALPCINEYELIYIVYVALYFCRSIAVSMRDITLSMT